MFIPYFPHQLLQDILQGNNAYGAAEFIDDDGDMKLGSLKLL